MTVICLVSAKGGVGKTTVTSNLGVILAKQGENVLLVDGNITTPTLGMHFGMAPKANTLKEVLENRIPVNSAVRVHASGVKLLPSSLAPEKSYPDPEGLKEKISSVRSAYDHILIDGAAGIGREVIASMEASDSLIVVTNTEITSAVSACKIIKLAEIMGIPVMGVVVNKSFNTRHQMTTSEMEELCERKVIGTIPFDARIPESLHRQSPIVSEKRSSKSARSFRKIASVITGKEIEEDSFSDKIKKLLSLW